MIHVVKYISTAVMGLILFLANIEVAPVVLEKGTVFVSRILMHEGGLKSDKSDSAVTLFFEQTAFELSSFLVVNHEWLTRLNEQGVIRGAYMEVQGKSVKLGEPFTPLYNTGAGYYLEEKALHFVYRSEESGIFLDAIVDTNRFSSFINPNMRKPRFVLLYDLFDGEEVYLHGRPWELPDMVYRRLKHPENGDFYLVTNKIIAAHMLSGMGEGIAVVSLYPIWSGRQLISTLALIVISVLSIILLALSIRYNLSSQLPFWKGATVMADNSGKKNLVYEIDREISDLFEDEALSEQPVEPVIKKPLKEVTKKQPAEVQSAEKDVIQKPPPEEISKEISIEKTGSYTKESVEQDLERDGIIIKKG